MALETRTQARTPMKAAVSTLPSVCIFSSSERFCHCRCVVEIKMNVELEDGSVPGKRVLQGRGVESGKQDYFTQLADMAT